MRPGATTRHSPSARLDVLEAQMWQWAVRICLKLACGSEPYLFYALHVYFKPYFMHVFIYAYILVRICICFFIYTYLYTYMNVFGGVSPQKVRKTPQKVRFSSKKSRRASSVKRLNSIFLVCVLIRLLVHVSVCTQQDTATHCNTLQDTDTSAGPCLVPPLPCLLHLVYTKIYTQANTLASTRTHTNTHASARAHTLTHVQTSDPLSLAHTYKHIHACIHTCDTHTQMSAIR